MLVRNILDDNNAKPLNVVDETKSRTIKAQYAFTSYPNIFKQNKSYGATGVAVPIQVGALARQNGELSHSQGFRIYSIDGKSVTINANGGGAKTGLYAIKADGKETPVYEVRNGKIKYKQGKYPVKLPDGFYIIRKLSVSECMRLQTIPEWYDFSVISQTRSYKCIGNGWTVEVIMHLIEQAMQGKTEESYVQLVLF